MKEENNVRERRRKTNNNGTEASGSGGSSDSGGGSGGGGGGGGRGSKSKGGTGGGQQVEVVKVTHTRSMEVEVEVEEEEEYVTTINDVSRPLIDHKKGNPNLNPNSSSGSGERDGDGQPTCLYPVLMPPRNAGMIVVLAYLLPMLVLMALALIANGGSKFIRLTSSDGCEARWMDRVNCETSQEFVCCNPTKLAATFGGSDLWGFLSITSHSHNPNPNPASTTPTHKNTDPKKDESGENGRRRGEEEGSGAMYTKKRKESTSTYQYAANKPKPKKDPKKGTPKQPVEVEVEQLETLDLCRASTSPITRLGTTLTGSILASLVAFMLNVLAHGVVHRRIRQGHKRRAVLYGSIILFRVLVLYKFVNLLEKLAQEEVKDCWYRQFRWRGRCGEAFNIADHVVLSLAQIVPIQLFETYCVLAEWRRVGLGLTLLFTVPAVAITMACYSSMYHTVTYFHTRAESAAALGLSIACVWVPLLVILFAPTGALGLGPGKGISRWLRKEGFITSR